ncbi:hypothetical protein [Haloarchaeobius sp. HRN-SO-5]|uniref:hypothetical protein n=1 Tax=Haloarchaeobius sp. HRN-SO-5 TaxID=3446118 RepID=UPI003EBE50E4
MSNTNPPDDSDITRRRLLQVTGGTVGLAGLGSTSAAGAVSAGTDSNAGTRCPEATFRPGIVHYDDSIRTVCSDGHPKTDSLQSGVRTSLEDRFPTVGSLIDAGFVPYFDFFSEGTWSHWVNPDWIGDDSVLDPDRPESVIVDHTWWRPIGVMFIATAGGDPVDPPPTIYRDGGDACMPWHAHVGLPGRYAWWKYQTVWGTESGLRCRTPWMLHVWKYSSPESVYAHGPPADRGGPPAESPGFDTDADPGAEELGPEHLPDAVRDEVAGLWLSSVW